MMADNPIKPLILDECGRVGEFGMAEIQYPLAYMGTLAAVRIKHECDFSADEAEFDDYGETAFRCIVLNRLRDRMVAVLEQSEAAIRSIDKRLAELR